jgi:hypothetical protein
MKKYVIHNNKIYYTNCKKVGDKYEISKAENVKDVTMDVLTVVRNYMEYIAKENNITNDPCVIFDDGTALRLTKLAPKEN